MVTLITNTQSSIPDWILSTIDSFWITLVFLIIVSISWWARSVDVAFQSIPNLSIGTSLAVISWDFIKSIFTNTRNSVKASISRANWSGSSDKKTLAIDIDESCIALTFNSIPIRIKSTSYWKLTLAINTIVVLFTKAHFVQIVILFIRSTRGN